MELLQAFTFLRSDNSDDRMQAIRRIYGRSEFSRLELRECLAHVKGDLRFPELGAVYYVLEKSTGAHSDLYYSGAPRKILNSCDPACWSGPIWDASAALAWEFARKAHWKVHPRSRRIVPEQECLGDFELLWRVLDGKDDCCEIYEEVRNVVLERAHFSEKEFELAKDLFEVKDTGQELLVCCAHVIDRHLGPDRLVQFVSGMEPERRQTLQTEIQFRDKLLERLHNWDNRKPQKTIWEKLIGSIKGNS